MPDHQRHDRHGVSGLKTSWRACARLHARALLTLLLVAGFAPAQQPAWAMELGEIEARSSLGEPFAARIPLQLAAGEIIGLECMRILPHPDAAQGMPLPPRLKSDIETIGGKQWLAIRTPALVSALMVGLRVEVDCGRQLARDFVVLLNPAPLNLPVVSPVPQTPATASTRPRRSASPLALAAPTQVDAKLTNGERPVPARAAARKGVTTQRMIAPAGEFVLRLDAGAPDLSRSDGITEAQRELLRAMWRLTADADDSMAARLAMASRIQQLEENLTALRGKLEQQQSAAASPAVAVSAPVAVPKPVAVPAPVDNELASALPWLSGAALTLLALAGTLWWRRRRQLAAAAELEPGAWASTLSAPSAFNTADTDQTSSVPTRPAAAERLFDGSGTVRLRTAPPLAAAPPVLTEAVAVAPAADIAVNTPPSAQSLDLNVDFAPPRENRSIPALDIDIDFTPPKEDPTRAAQEEYFAGRFGAHSQDIRLLQDLDTVIEQARSIYQDDGDPHKAADMLELTIALHPDSVRLWLTLFAIYRRESRPRQYALLAHKFGARFAADPNWPIVQQLGREIDADNLLYGPLAPSGGVDTAPVDGASEDDVVDRWLGVQLDFNNTLLAAELRERLVSGATAGGRLRRPVVS